MYKSVFIVLHFYIEKLQVILYFHGRSHCYILEISIFSDLTGLSRVIPQSLVSYFENSYAQCLFSVMNTLKDTCLFKNLNFSSVVCSQLFTMFYCIISVIGFNFHLSSHQQLSLLIRAFSVMFQPVCRPFSKFETVTSLHQRLIPKRDM